MVNPTSKILLVEDDAAIRDSVHQFLEIEGYSVDSVQNGREALDYLEAAPRPGLILLDWTMPVMDGPEFLAAAKTTEAISDVPVVIFTAVGHPIAPNGAIGVIAKPIDADDLLASVSHYFGKPQPEKQTQQ